MKKPERRYVIATAGMAIALGLLTLSFTNMKTILHTSDTRGAADYGWLKARYSFSFSQYYNPSRMEFGALRVLNDDQIAPAMGFGAHPHDNMEIVTIPLSGMLKHKDSQGNEGIITAGEVQIMSAGKGIRHSEVNASSGDTLRLLQIWVMPKEKNIDPRYDQKRFDDTKNENSLVVVVSPDTTTGAMYINQDAQFVIGNLNAGVSQDYTLFTNKNGAYIFLVEGQLEVGGHTLNTRDALGVWEADKVTIKATEKSKFVIIDVPMNY